MIYVVEPRLPGLGTALLANARRGTPIILEIDDLETGVAPQAAGNRPRETAFDSVNFAEPELLDPRSDAWSRVLAPIAEALPVLATHNDIIDARFGHRCLHMRKLAHEATYDPALYDRQAVRAELGFAPDDRIILVGGTVRPPGGLRDLIDALERLDDARCKLVFVGPHAAPGQTPLIDKLGDRLRLLPPQDRVAMARLSLAADLAILWHDPDVPAGTARMPDMFTEALAMTTPIIASDMFDLGDLARQGYLRQVPAGNGELLAKAVGAIFADPKAADRMAAAARRLFLRRFGYAAARGNFALMLHRMHIRRPAPLPSACQFSDWFEDFRRTTVARDSTGYGTAHPSVSLSQPPRRYRIAIKTSVPSMEVANEWGDYHFAVALEASLRALGHVARVDLNPDWYAPQALADDVVVVLRGRHAYKPQPGQLNLMWNISHPDRITRQEHEGFDHVFIASLSEAEALAPQVNVPVSALLQCTDAVRFQPPAAPLASPDPLLFVGNSRNVYRKIVKDAISAGLSPAVYGTRWSQYIGAPYLKGEHIANEELAKHYYSASIVLNDHWETMASRGFVSNRLFDAGASGAFLISDYVLGIEQVFADTVPTYQTPADLKSLVEFFLAHPEARRQKSERLRSIVVSGHTFDNRAIEIVSVINRLAARTPSDRAGTHRRGVQLTCG